MKAPETSCKTQPVAQAAPHAVATYQKALDGRKRPIRGLWVRNGRFYAQLYLEDPGTGQKRVKRVPLFADAARTQPVQTTAEAREACERLKLQRAEGALPVMGRTPKFSDCVEQYIASLRALKASKRASTIEKERSSLRLWSERYGEVRVDRLSLAMINAFRQARLAEGLSPRTVNLDCISLRNALRFAQENGWVRELPSIKPLKWKPRVRRLVTTEEVDRLCSAAQETGKNGSQFVDYIRLMCYCGSRRNETLRLRWEDLDWEHQQLLIGSDGLAKNRESRRVDFNPTLRQLLERMRERRVPDSKFLFPSPLRGDKDLSLRTFKETLNLAREKAGLPHFGFHDCRHHFISMAVMSGVDFMTIAAWVGHKDGGVLIGKVYGHLADDHKKAMAERLAFEPVYLAPAESA